jgi:hypothetical protein
VIGYTREVEMRIRQVVVRDRRIECAARQLLDDGLTNHDAVAPVRLL